MSQVLISRLKDSTMMIACIEKPAIQIGTHEQKTTQLEMSQRLRNNY